MANHNEIGKVGETEAVNYLMSKGYIILETNWTYKHLEIDIIAQQNKTLIIAEVKTRQSNYFGEPEEWVSKQKQRNLIAAANAFIEKSGNDLDVRFDIVSIIMNQKETKINHIIDAFSVMM